jgi:hypothetical protein
MEQMILIFMIELYGGCGHLIKDCTGTFVKGGRNIILISQVSYQEFVKDPLFRVPVLVVAPNIYIEV